MWEVISSPLLFASFISLHPLSMCSMRVCRFPLLLLIFHHCHHLLRSFYFYSMSACTCWLTFMDNTLPCNVCELSVVCCINRLNVFQFNGNSTLAVFKMQTLSEYHVFSRCSKPKICNPANLNRPRKLCMLYLYAKSVVCHFKHHIPYGQIRGLILSSENCVLKYSLIRKPKRWKT